MEVIWAPWRMEYILSDQKAGECIFCPGVDRKRDEQRLILFAGPLTMIMMNRFPYINGHLLVSPVRHVPDLSGLSGEERLDLMDMVDKSVTVLKKVMGPEGFNIGLNLGKVAGAGVESHMHFHIVPRWAGDTNYMSVLAEVRVIPEHIRETYSKLLPHFKEFNPISGGDA
ncbi:MAG: HIT domain-containing protein [Deltaproteobacteria bacterium]|nr:HIT domain-containing protein [Deltaproteobacteria bacterium]HEN20475.1 HIT domain-containing protein [Desulfobacteraceae bacterium]